MTVEKKTGAVLVVGGGLAGIQAALDLADGGFYVYLLEQSSAIGSSMARLDRTFPTNDCSMCIMAPQLVACGRHANITIICQTEVEEILGAAGNFTVTVYEKPRYVDPNHCIACGLCAEKCPVEVKDPVHADVSLRRAIHISYPQAVPSCYTIDASSCLHLNGKAKCTLCMSACERGAINFNDQPRTYTLQVGAIILAPGGEIYNPSQVPLWGYGKFGNVITALQFEQYLSPTGQIGRAHV
jgi:heterodisulfide reductase subunit A